MMMTDGAANPAEQFVRFWSDMMSQAGQAAGIAGGAANPQPQAAAPAFTEQAKAMQRAMFDAMSRYFDEFMRSEQFLEQMKQTMQQSLAVKKMMDEFLIRAQTTLQSPVRGDVEDLAQLLRGIERRVLDRLDSLEAKVAAVEERQSPERGAAARQAPRSGKSPKGSGRD